MANLPGDSIQIAREYLDSLLMESRIVGAQKPSARFEFLGEVFDTPIMTAALSHIDLVNMALGAKAAGAAVSIGMGDNETFGAVLDTGAKVMKIIKPYADPEQVFSRLRYAKERGAIAVGMDVEHAIHADSPENDCIHGLEMALPSLEQLRNYITYTDLPFFIKGALSVQDALTCRNLGCRGIILSHHNGLMRYAVPPVRLLPNIRKAVGDAFLLIADGGIESGYDAFKALALGADAVTVGRPLMQPLKDEGAKGVCRVLKTMTAQLEAVMYRTGSKDLKHIDPGVIWEK